MRAAIWSVLPQLEAHGQLGSITGLPSLLAILENSKYMSRPQRNAAKLAVDILLSIRQHDFASLQATTDTVCGLCAWSTHTRSHGAARGITSSESIESFLRYYFRTLLWL
jgi:hypothetical protein